jgi:hypothetical protein
MYPTYTIGRGLSIPLHNLPEKHLGLRMLFTLEVDHIQRGITFPISQHPLGLKFLR